jgi:uncharacterized protein (TIGR02186 family)
MTMRLWLILFLALLAAPLASAQAQRPPDLAAAVTDDTIAVTSDFRGARITVFGAAAERRGGGDLVVTVRGPNQNVTLMRKRRFYGLWLNTDPVPFEEAPSFFALISAKPMTTFANPSTITAYGLDPGASARLVAATPADADPAAYRAALVRLKRNRGLYQEQPNGLQLRTGGLFSASVQLPASAPPGIYQVDVFLFRRGAVVANETSSVIIQRVGIEQVVYGFAMERPLLYGLVAVAMALLAGWAASFLFRRS